MEPYIRFMIRRDMPEVIQIEALSFAKAWSDEDFIRCLRQRNCMGMVAEDTEKERAVGYMIYGLHKSRLDLMNIAVHPVYRRLGVGLHLINKLKSKLSYERRQRLTATIADFNLDGQLFLKAMGLKAVRVIPDYFDDCDADAYEMEYRVALETRSVSEEINGQY